MKTFSRPEVSRVFAFVDGSVDKNNANIFSRGAGGVIFVETQYGMVQRIKTCTEYVEGEQSVTNSRMELLAFGILASASVMFFGEDEQRIIPVWSDSIYTINILFNKTWTAKKNRDLIDLILGTLRRNNVIVVARHIKAHQGFFLNELADYACLRTRKTARNINMDIEFKAIDAQCLTCKFFPCVNGVRANKKTWTDAFALIRENSYMACDRYLAYADVSPERSVDGSSFSHKAGRSAKCLIGPS